VLVRHAYLLTKFGSPAAKNGSPERQASAIFNPWDVHLEFDIFKMAVVAMVNMKVKTYLFDLIVMNLHMNDPWGV